jgi:hypothetical protein
MDALTEYLQGAYGVAAALAGAFSLSSAAAV